MRFPDGRRGCRVRWRKSLKDIYCQVAPSAVDYRRPASELQAGVTSSRTEVAGPWAKIYIPGSRSCCAIS